MATTNHAAREIDCKIVYCGPASSGKTTNLRVVHGSLDPALCSTLIAPTTDGDHTLFFDFLAVEMGTVRGYRLRLHLFTVPGEGPSDETRRIVLSGVDGVVFVADSQRDRLSENVASLAHLDGDLATADRSLEDVPCVLQYNKRDLPEALPVAELETELNPRGLQAFEAIAIEGEGVLESLTAISKQVVAALG